jgi:hypothetical protein
MGKKNSVNDSNVSPAATPTPAAAETAAVDSSSESGTTSGTPTRSTSVIQGRETTPAFVHPSHSSPSETTCSSYDSKDNQSIITYIRMT